MAESDSKSKADIYLALADGARRDFQTVYGIEWRVNLGLWTFFVAGTATIGTMDKWLLHALVSWSVIVVSWVIVVVYAIWWLPHLQDTRELWTRTVWWWSMATVPEAFPDVAPKSQTSAPEPKVPDFTLPNYLKPDGWECPYVPIPFKPESKTRWGWLRFWRPKKGNRWDRLHPSHIMCIVVTCLLCALFSGAIWIRMAAGPEPPSRNTPPGSPSGQAMSKQMPVGGEKGAER